MPSSITDRNALTDDETGPPDDESRSTDNDTDNEDSTTTKYLTRDDYIESRTRQERLINDALNSVRQSLDEVKDDVHNEFRQLEDKFEARFVLIDKRLNEIDNRFNGRFNDMDNRFNGRFNDMDNRFNGRFNDMELSILRMEAYSRNNNIRNPLLRINPIVSYRPGHGIIQPKPELYPKNAKEFYGLREPQNSRQKDMLAYLISFYDLPDITWRPYPAETSSNEDGTHESQSIANRDVSINYAMQHQYDQAIDHLEAILGLNSDNFVQFQQKAAEFGQMPVQPAKRHLEPGSTDHGHDNFDSGPRKHRGHYSQRPTALDIRVQSDGQEHMETKDRDDDKSTSTRLGWDDSKSPSINRKLRAMYQYQSSSETETTTNPNTDPPLSQEGPR